jgi:hypothetical protein
MTGPKRLHTYLLAAPQPPAGHHTPPLHPILDLGSIPILSDDESQVL